MTTPADKAGKRQLLEAAGAGTGIDAEYAARLRRAGSFFWLDLFGVPPERTAEFSAALGLNADAARHLADSDQRSGFTATDDGVRWVSYGMREKTT